MQMFYCIYSVQLYAIDQSTLSKGTRNSYVQAAQGAAAA